MMKRIVVINSALILTLVLCTIASTQIAVNAQSGKGTSKLLSELRFRCIGPSVSGGRVHDIEALPDNASMIYVATASGGIWIIIVEEESPRIPRQGWVKLTSKN